MQRILLVDPDRSITQSLAPFLQKAGYQVRCAYDGQQAIRAKLEYSPDLILLSWMLPDIHGLEVCQQIRRTCTTPVILLTTRSERTAPLRGLELCADDTLTKPFSTREALAHIHAVLRRVEMDKHGHQRDSIQFGEFNLDPAGRRFQKGQSELQLSAREFDLILTLVENAGRALSRAELMARVWGSQWFGDPHTLDVHIRWLRLKIEEDPASPRYIKTVHGFGYRFASQIELAAT